MIIDGDGEQTEDQIALLSRAEVRTGPTDVFIDKLSV